MEEGKDPIPPNRVDASPHVMTVDEVAAYLRIPRSSVYNLAQQGRLPCQKAWWRWRFSRKAVDAWLAGAVEARLVE